MSRVAEMDWGLELRLRPPSRDSAARTSFSQWSKLSGSSSCVINEHRSRGVANEEMAYHFCVQLFQFCILFIATAKAVIGHGALLRYSNIKVREFASISNDMIPHEM